MEQQVQPRYYQIKNIITKGIQEGKYMPHTKVPSLNQLMKEYAISNMTAVRIINELSQQGIIYTVQGKGSFVTEKANNENMQKDIINNKRVVFICPTNSGERYFHEVLVGVMDVMQSTGYKFEVYNSEYDYSKETGLLAKCLEEPPAGLIFLAHHADRDYNHLFQLLKKKIPVVLINNPVRNMDFDIVGFDMVKETRKAIKQLVTFGHKKIVFLGCSEELISTYKNLEGYRQALCERKIKFDPSLVLDAHEEGNTAGKSGYLGLKGFLDKNIKFTAIFTINTGLAVKAYEMITAKGLKIPDDVSIIGIIDNETAQDFDVPVTNMTIDVTRVGKSAAKLLLRRIDASLYKKPEIENPGRAEKIILPLELTKRDSVKDIRKKK